MSVTEAQKAFHLRKMRTRMTRMDVNKDGFISREDYELMATKLAEYGEMTKEEGESTYKAFMQVADEIGLKLGVKFPVEAAKKASEAILSMTRERQMAMLYPSHNVLFDVIDSNKDGHISAGEFKVYFQVIAAGMSEADVCRSFNTIDSNGDGVINREEFLAAAAEFLCGLEETDLANAYLGQLLS